MKRRNYFFSDNFKIENISFVHAKLLADGGRKGDLSLIFQG